MRGGGVATADLDVEGAAMVSSVLGPENRYKKISHEHKQLKERTSIFLRRLLAADFRYTFKAERLFGGGWIFDIGNKVRLQCRKGEYGLLSVYQNHVKIIMKLTYPLSRTSEPRADCPEP